ncbi:type III-A CRISPR-associated RAMP protein Csm4 [Nostoc sp. JL33]|uniref:type III-A CRISPR-associated RAMP protein Csm4 n=1 Tax=Nostoc sp. JL33 TaxID=2815396 RepID=UPI0025E46AF8|nr:type III-A CRISPR-associated RAMP protein Csm4 [Nostoc sp. JL33]MBN3873709.1 type III-A CRISPR-associated RAMP protein Csm4 [Nostoc sp. JL33]
MSIWKLARLKFGRTLAHFGELGIGLENTSERVPSDTLFSAWMSAYAKLFGRDAATNLLEQFNTQSEAPFRLSSTFIYQKIEKKLIYYLPRPLSFPPNYPVGDDLDFTKAYKGLKYLPLEIWQRWYQGDGFTDSAELQAKTKDKAKGELTNAGTFDYNKAFEISKVPKIAVDRITSATNIYNTAFVQYNWTPNNQQTDDIEPLAGLYFLVNFSDSDLENTFFAVLDFLGGEGIGGERSSGAGQFKAERDELSTLWQQIIDFTNANHHSLISLFWQHPLPEEFLNNASYELQQRGGWLASSTSDGRQLRRKSVQMFTEGSVFSVLPQGRLADVTPEKFTDHKVYRSGISLSLPIKVHGE